MSKILIQANNLDTAIDVFMYIYMHPDCSKQEIADYCGFSLRQVDYYTNACKYLDLIDDNWRKTDLAIDIFSNNPAEITERVYLRIITDDIIREIFGRLYMFPDEEHFDFTKELIKKNFPGYSEAVYNRRSSNMLKWCEKIIKYVNNK